MAEKKRLAKKKAPRRKPTRNGGPEELLAANAVSAFHDESYQLALRAVQDVMKEDPEFAERIRAITRQYLDAWLEKLRSVK